VFFRFKIDKRQNAMPKLNPKTRMPSVKEDAAITKAARSDPDSLPFSEREWKKVKPQVHVARSKSMSGMRAIHPGEVLREEFLLPMGLTANALAIALQVPAPRINDVAREKRGISADTALRLARYFGTSAEFWMGLQADYDLKTSAQDLKAVLKRIHPRKDLQTA
jgi:addiction module HigA family antidote